MRSSMSSRNRGSRPRNLGSCTGCSSPSRPSRQPNRGPGRGGGSEDTSHRPGLLSLRRSRRSTSSQESALAGRTPQTGHASGRLGPADCAGRGSGAVFSPELRGEEAISPQLSPPPASGLIARPGHGLPSWCLSAHTSLEAGRGWPVTRGGHGSGNSRRFPISASGLTSASSRQTVAVAGWMPGGLESQQP
jgi:hypothetical protein